MRSWQNEQGLPKKQSYVILIFLLSPVGSRVRNIQYRQNIVSLRIIEVVIDKCRNVQARNRPVNPGSPQC